MADVHKHTIASDSEPVERTRQLFFIYLNKNVSKEQDSVSKASQLQLSVYKTTPTIPQCFHGHPVSLHQHCSLDAWQQHWHHKRLDNEIRLWARGEHWNWLCALNPIIINHCLDQMKTRWYQIQQDVIIRFCFESYLKKKMNKNDWLVCSHSEKQNCLSRQQSGCSCCWGLCKTAHEVFLRGDLGGAISPLVGIRQNKIKLDVEDHGEHLFSAVQKNRRPGWCKINNTTTSQKRKERKMSVHPCRLVMVCLLQG